MPDLHASYLGGQIGSSFGMQQTTGLKKINITFNQHEAMLLRESIIGSTTALPQHQANESYSPKLRHASKQNNFLRRNPNYMNQTARDTTPVKL
jgi:hypothetical protein